MHVLSVFSSHDTAVRLYHTHSYVQRSRPTTKNRHSHIGGGKPISKETVLEILVIYSFKYSRYSQVLQSFSALSTQVLAGTQIIFSFKYTPDTGRYSVLFSFTYSRYWQALCCFQLQVLQVLEGTLVIFCLKCSWFSRILKSFSAFGTPGTGSYSVIFSVKYSRYWRVLGQFQLLLR